MNLSTDFDTEQFIADVRARPAIWDAESPDYVNKHLKNRCWDEVCLATYPDYEQEDDEQKAEISKLMRRRWRSLRDCYTRELNAQTSKNRKSTLARQKNKKKTYVFFDHLHFIRPSVEKRTTRYYAAGEVQQKDHSDHDSEDPSVEYDLLADLPIDCKIDETYSLEEFDQQDQPKTSTLIMGNSRKRKADGESHDFKTRHGESNILTPEPTGVFDVPQSTNNPDQDQDRMFLLSLLDDVKKVNESHRLDLKRDIISAIRKWQKMPSK